MVAKLLRIHMHVVYRAVPLLRRIAGSAALVAVIAACGGAGDATSGNGSPIVSVDSLLFGPNGSDGSQGQPEKGMVKANIGMLSQMAVLPSGFTLTLAKMVADAWTDAPGAGPKTRTLGCVRSGSVEYVYEDVDASGHASLGDRLTIRWRDCWLDEFGSAQTGTVVTTRLAPSSAEYTFTAQVVFDSANARLPGQTLFRMLSGSLIVQGRSETVADTWNVRSATSDDVQFTYPLNDPSTKTIVLREVDFTKSVRYDQASIEVSLSADMTAPATDGPIRVRTHVPMRAMIDTYPVAGQLSLSDDRGRQILIEPQLGAQSVSAMATLIPQPDENLRHSEPHAWSFLSTPGLWWGERGSISVIQPALPFVPLSVEPAAAVPSELRISVDAGRSLILVKPQAPQGISVLPTLRFQFSRPPVASFQPRMRFDPLPRPSEYGPSNLPSAIAARVEVRGALMLVTPLQQLDYDRTYVISTGLSQPFPGMVTVAVDATGSRVAIESIQLHTRLDLEAQIDAPGGMIFSQQGDTLTLDGSASRALVAPVVGYRWQQVSGPPVQFSAPEQRLTQVTLAGMAPAQTQRAIVALQLTDSLGQTATKQIELVVLGTDLPLVLQVQGEPGAWMFAGRTVIGTEAYGRMTVLSFEPGREFWVMFSGGSDLVGVRVVAPAGQALDNGVYEGAVPFPTGSEPTLMLSGGSCQTTIGRFVIRDLVIGGNGRPSRIAVDFEARCSGQGPAVRGMIRLGSALPALP